MIGPGGVNATVTLRNRMTGTPLWWVAQEVILGNKEGGLALAKNLLEKGADIDAIGRDVDGNESTPLVLAAIAVNGGKEGGLVLATFLMEMGADVNAVCRGADGSESTPLVLAARAVCKGEDGGLVLAKFLMEKGADVNAVCRGADGSETTPLLLAITAVGLSQKGGLALATLLVERGVDVNAYHPSGRHHGASNDPVYAGWEASVYFYFSITTVLLLCCFTFLPSCRVP